MSEKNEVVPGALVRLVSVEELILDYDVGDPQVGDVCVALEAGSSQEGAPNISVRSIRTGYKFELLPSEWELVR
jgi:hypothetical protein